MVTIDGEGGGAPPGPGRSFQSIDSLRADLAETRLLVHELRKQLDETNVKLQCAEDKNAVAGGRNDVDASMGVVHEARDTIKRLEKEVSGLNTKARMMGVHNDLLVEGEKARKKP
jgi:hypothetical protein